MFVSTTLPGLQVKACSHLKNEITMPFAVIDCAFRLVPLLSIGHPKILRYAHDRLCRFRPFSEDLRKQQCTGYFFTL